MIKTSCKDCIFRLNNESGLQIDCAQGRLKIFEKQNKISLTENYYTIDRLCNTCRADNSNLSDPFQEVGKIRKEVSVPFYLIVNCEDNQNIPIDIINKIAKSQYENLTVHFIFNSGRFINLFNGIRNTVNNRFKFKVSKTLQEEDSINFVVSSIVKELKPDYFVGYTDACTDFDPNTFKEIDERVNDELRTLAAYISRHSVFFHKNILAMMFKEATSVLDLDFYVSRVIAWADYQNKRDVIWVKE